MALSEKQQAFVDEYMFDLNATQAAIRAGYSPKTANSCASRLLSKANIQDAIAVKCAERARRAGINADRTLMELGRLAFYSPADVIDMDTGELINHNRDELRIITKVKVKTTTRTSKDGCEETTTEREYQFADKLKALDLIMRHLGVDRPKQEGQLDGTYGVVLLPAVEELQPPPDDADD